MNEDLKWIKKHYSEKMMHICRECFPSLLETPKLLPNLLKDNFYNHKSLAEDITSQDKIDSFKTYIFSLTETDESNYKTKKNPYELMDEAGYTLYKCETKEDVEKFMKYYKVNELLCTFNNIEGRLDRCDIFFAVKKDVDKIKRSDRPLRQDEYGTSVISIQFNKSKVNNVSIKNRYNHTVNNPDATFQNNLDNIIKGLTNSFAKEFGYNVTSSDVYNLFEMIGYVQGPDYKYYKTNVEADAINYCADNIMIKDDKVTQFDKEKYILIENFLLDLVNKKITNLVSDNTVKMTFENIFGDIKDIKVLKFNDNKVITITNTKEEQNLIIINKNNEIIKLVLPHVEHIEDNFLFINRKLESITLPKVKTIGNGFLCYNGNIYDVKMPLVEYIGNDFLYYTGKIISIELPSLIEAGDNFLIYREKLEEIKCLKLEKVGESFLRFNKNIKNINFPSLIKTGNEFICHNSDLTDIYTPNIEEVGDRFLYHNTGLESIRFPKLRRVGCEFISSNNDIENVELPNLEYIESDFLYDNRMLENLDLPKVKEIGDWFMSNNRKLTSIYLPKVETIGRNFLSWNFYLMDIDLPKIQSVGDDFLHSNQNIDERKRQKFEQKSDTKKK